MEDSNFKHLTGGHLSLDERISLKKDKWGVSTFIGQTHTINHLLIPVSTENENDVVTTKPLWC